MKAVVALVALVVSAGACQPGWVNAMIGSGDGSGTTPGTAGESYESAALEQPTGLASGPDGSVYVYDAGACAVYRMRGDTLSLYAGTPGSCGDSGDGGAATSAQIDAGIPVAPTSGAPKIYPIAVDGSGNVYFFGSNWTLRRVDAATGVISAAAIPHENTENAIPGVTGLATDRNGSIVVLLWTYRYQGPPVDAPTSADVLRFDGGSFTTVTSWDMTTLADHDLTQPAVGLAVLADGSYLTTTPLRNGPFHLFRVDPSTGTAVDVRSDSGVVVPWALTADALGNAYVTTSTNQVIRVEPDGSSTVVAGSGVADPGTTRQFGQGTDLYLSPAGLAMSPNGNLLFSSGHTVYHLHDPAHVSSIQVAT